MLDFINLLKEEKKKQIKFYKEKKDVRLHVYLFISLFEKVIISWEDEEKKEKQLKKKN